MTRRLFRTGLTTVACMTIAMLLLVGCEPPRPVVEFSYFPLPSLPMPPGSLAVAPFVDDEAGFRVSRAIELELAKAVLSGRLRNNTILANPAFQAGAAPCRPPVDNASACALARAIGADMIIFGKVRLVRTVVTGDVPDASLSRARASAGIDYALADARTGAGPWSGSVVSDEPDAPGLDPLAELIKPLCEEIAPSLRVVRCALPAGRTAESREGDRLAVAGKYEEALAAYRLAVAADLSDPAASFNAGLMCEAIGKLGEARDFYHRSVKLGDLPQCEESLRRLDDWDD